MKSLTVCGAIVLLGTLFAAPAAQAQFNYTTNNGAISITGYTGSGAAVTIPAQITGLPVASIGDWAFYSTGVINVTISDTVTNIGDGAFFDCASLTNVTIGANVTNIGDWAFGFCASLTNVNFRGNSPALAGTNVFYGDSATVNYLPATAAWGPMFGGLAAVLWNPPVPYKYTTNNGAITITKYTGPGGAVAIPTTINFLPVTSIGYWAFSSTGVINVTISDTVTNIGENAFFLCESLTNVTFGTNVASIGYGAFDSCTSLTNITIPGSVTCIGDGAFYACTHLTNFSIPVGTTSIGVFAFSGCSSLSSVTIPAGVTNIGDYAFAAILWLAALPTVSAQCGSLAAINVDAQNAFYRSINGVLFDKSASTLIQYPGGMGGGYTIPGSVASIASEAFCGSALTSVTIPGSVTNFGDYAFACCASLTTVTIANGVTGIGRTAVAVFTGCSNLTSITIPGSVGSIGGDEFADCGSLTNATIGNGVTNIGESAFAYCRSLTSVYFRGNAPAASSAAFAFDANATVYYLPGTTGWSNSFAGRPAVLWNPLIQTGDGSFGVQNNQFGFNITGTTNIPIVVEASTSLASPVWIPLQSLTLTNGSYFFSEPFQPVSSQRYYRISSQ